MQAPGASGPAWDYAAAGSVHRQWVDRSPCAWPGQRTLSEQPDSVATILYRVFLLALHAWILDYLSLWNSQALGWHVRIMLPYWRCQSLATRSRAGEGHSPG